MAEKVDLGDVLSFQLRVLGIEHEREYRFAPPRLFRFDIALPNVGLAIECEGGTWSNGRHTRGAGYAKDTEKYNLAVLRGWRVLRFVTNAINSGEALKVIEEAIGSHGVVVLPLWLTVNGKKKCVGELEGSLFRKRVSKSKHFLRRPPAIAIDAAVWDDIKGKIETIEVIDADTGEVYRAQAVLFESAKVIINRGYGVQYALPLEYWGGP